MKILHKARESLSKITSTVVVTGMVAYTNVAFALENEHADDFKTLYDQLLGWAGGTLGKSIALLFLLIGLVRGLSRGSIYAAVVSIAAGLSLVLAPSIIDSIFGAA